MTIKNRKTGEPVKRSILKQDRRVLEILDREVLADLAVTADGILVLLGVCGNWYEFPFGRYYMEGNKDE